MVNIKQQQQSLLAWNFEVQVHFKKPMSAFSAMLYIDEESNLIIYLSSGDNDNAAVPSKPVCPSPLWSNTDCNKKNYTIRKSYFWEFSKNIFNFIFSY